MCIFFLIQSFTSFFQTLLILSNHNNLLSDNGYCTHVNTDKYFSFHIICMGFYLTCWTFDESMCSTFSRITLASIGLTWLVIGTSAVGLLPNWRWLQTHKESFYSIFRYFFPNGYGSSFLCASFVLPCVRLCFQDEVLAQWMGACDVLQDLCSRTFCHHPLSQQVNKPPSFNLSNNQEYNLTLTSCLHLPTTGKTNHKKEESVWPITPLLLT